jgi:hypothetical protein
VVAGDDSDYWGVDDNSVVFVADPNFGNILNFNVGSNIDIQIPPNFWTRLTSTLPLLNPIPGCPLRLSGADTRAAATAMTVLVAHVSYVRGPSQGTSPRATLDGQVG